MADAQSMLDSYKQERTDLLERLLEVDRKIEETQEQIRLGNTETLNEDIPEGLLQDEEDTEPATPPSRFTRFRSSRFDSGNE